jgi:hypothetical protein
MTRLLDAGPLPGVNDGGVKVADDPGGSPDMLSRIVPVKEPPIGVTVMV